MKISLKFAPRGPINNIPALVQMMAWRRPGNKPISGPMMVSLVTHICITQWNQYGDTCQIWLCFTQSNQYICKIQNFRSREQIFGNPNPWSQEKMISSFGYSSRSSGIWLKKAFPIIKLTTLKEQYENKCDLSPKINPKCYVNDCLYINQQNIKMFPLKNIDIYPS